VKPLVYHCEADVELVAAAKYYECQREHLGRELLHAVHRALAMIQDDPGRSPFFDKPARACRIGGFPYRIVYELLPDAIHVLAIMHTSRAPGYWKNRFS